MKIERNSLGAYILLRMSEMNQSRTVLDEELGWVFYPCENSIREALEKSMA